MGIVIMGADGKDIPLEQYEAEQAKKNCPKCNKDCATCGKLCDECTTKAINEQVQPPPEVKPITSEDIKTSGPPPGPGPTAEEMARNRADIAQNYDDLASPGRINQGALNDCYIVSTLNEVNSTPGGQAHLASRITDLGDGFSQVTINDRFGVPQQVVVQNPPLGIGASGDQTLRIYEKALAVSETPPLGGLTNQEIYSNINHGGFPNDTMNQLGLEAVGGGDVQRYTASSTVPWATQPDTAVVWGTRSGSTPGLTSELQSYGLVTSPHAYEVVATAPHTTTTYTTVPTYDAMGSYTGTTSVPVTSTETHVYLRNPWGHHHPDPIPLSAVDRLFQPISAVGQ